MTEELKPCPTGESDVAVWIPRDQLRQAPQVKVAMDERPCTCHPDDRPPVPCTKQYALLDCLRARIAELEKAREPIEVGYVIVDENPLTACYSVADTIEEAWDDFNYGALAKQSFDDRRRDYESKG